MNRLKPFVNLPEVRAGVICDLSGTLMELSSIDDAESVAAVIGYFVNVITQCGESLGLSEPTTLYLTGRDLSCCVLAEDKLLWIFYLDPSCSIQEFERKITAMKKPGRIG